MYETILVATDGSDPANRALDQAIDLSATFDAELHVIAVVDTRRYGDSELSGSESVVDSLADRAEGLLADATAQADIDVATELRRGRPHKEIASYAEDRDVDLVVLGHHGIGSGGEIGSTAERVVRYVDRPVLTA